MSSFRTIALFGSTGLIGKNVLDVVRAHPQSFYIHILIIDKNIADVLLQIKEFKPRYVFVSHRSSCAQLQQKLQGISQTVISCEPEDLRNWILHDQVTDIIFASSGTFALPFAYAAAKIQHKRLLIANKELFIVAGQLLMKTARHFGSSILSLDSEHAAFEQITERLSTDEMSQLKYIITASGGAVREIPLSDYAHLSVVDVLKHPSWKMGAKITVDSATMVNKALELIECCVLFDLSADQVSAVLHKESLVHALIEYPDGSYVAQISATDMRLPIARALWQNSFQETEVVHRLSFTQRQSFSFEPIDQRRYPAFFHVYDVLQGGLATCLFYNEVNEFAVACFLNGQFGFLQISQFIDFMLQSLPDLPNLDGIEDIIRLQKEVQLLCECTLKKFMLKK